MFMWSVASGEIQTKMNSEAVYGSWTSFRPIKQKLVVVIRLIKSFTRFCSQCKLEDELKTLCLSL